DRYFDGDIGGSASDDEWRSTFESVWARTPQTPTVVPNMLLLTTTNQDESLPHGGRIEYFASWNPLGIGPQTARTCGIGGTTNWAATGWAEWKPSSETSRLARPRPSPCAIAASEGILAAAYLSIADLPGGGPAHGGRLPRFHSPSPPPLRRTRAARPHCRGLGREVVLRGGRSRARS